MEKIKWMALENADATATLKQHGYIKTVRKMPYTLEPYESNAQLCNGKGFCSEDGETGMNFDDIEYYETEPSASACKKCLKIYQKIKDKEVTPSSTSE